MWGLSSIYAYRAYQDQYFLDSAITIWTVLSAWRVTGNNTNAVSNPIRDVPVNYTCNGGKQCATFWITHMPNNTLTPLIFPTIAPTAGAVFYVNRFPFVVTPSPILLRFTASLQAVGRRCCSWDSRVCCSSTRVTLLLTLTYIQSLHGVSLPILVAPSR